MATPASSARAAAVLVSFALVVTGCGKAPVADHGTVRFGVLPLLDSLPYHVMRGKGFAAAEGLRLEAKTYEGGGPAIEGIRIGEIDAAYPSLFPILVAVRIGTIPQDVVAIAASAVADREHPAAAVLVRPEVGSWKDLTGARIAVDRKGSITHVAVETRLRREGVTRYTVGEIPFPNLGLAVAGGNVSAAGMLEPFVAQSVLRGDGRVLDWVIGGEPFPEFATSELVVARSLADRPAAARALVRAHLRALRWMMENPAEARRILVRTLGLAAEVGDAVRMYAWSTDGRMDDALVARVQGVLVAEGFAEKAVSVEQVLDERFLP